MKESAASLYVTSVRHVARNFDKFSMLDLSRHLTESMRFDVYWEIFASSSTSSATSRKVRRRLIREMAKLDVFFALLHVGHRRMELHNMFQVIAFLIFNPKIGCSFLWFSVLQLEINHWFNTIADGETTFGNACSAKATILGQLQC